MPTIGSRGVPSCRPSVIVTLHAPRATRPHVRYRQPGFTRLLTARLGSFLDRPTTHEIKHKIHEKGSNIYSRMLPPGEDA